MTQKKLQNMLQTYLTHKDPTEILTFFEQLQDNTVHQNDSDVAKRDIHSDGNIPPIQVFSKIIKIIKFRSMHVDAEIEGIQWSKNNDKRITRIGRILRALRIDELPQLFCVLLGSMSLIGPRPERPEIEKKLFKKIPYYKSRYILKPGISGWAQVNYHYGASIADTKQKLSYDIYYISNFSFFLDLLIFFKTIKLVLNAKGYKPKKNIIDNSPNTN